jgi:hypothetical protein
LAREEQRHLQADGPRIVSGIDPMNQVIEVRVNGRTVSSYNTSG